MLVHIVLLLELLEYLECGLHVSHDHTALQEAVEHDCGSELEFLSVLGEEGDDSVEELLRLLLLDASAEGANGEVVGEDVELDHTVEHVPGLAQVSRTHQAVDDCVLSNNG